MAFLARFARRTHVICHDRKFIIVKQGFGDVFEVAGFAEDKAADARAKFHSTAREAATIAMKAGVKKLVIGHFSARYNDPDQLLKEAQEVFAETILGEDGLKIEV